MDPDHSLIQIRVRSSTQWAEYGPDSKSYDRIPDVASCPDPTVLWPRIKIMEKDPSASCYNYSFPE